jgi:hypothetical protein
MPLRKPIEDEHEGEPLFFKAPAVAVEHHMVGVFRAEYTPLTAEQMTADDAALEDLYKNSKHVSR